MRQIIFVVLILSTSFFIYAEDKDVFMVYGDDHMVNIPLPKYWQVDMGFAQRNGINAFFFLEDLGINNSPVGIILTLANRPDDETVLNDYIVFDKSTLQDYYPDMIHEQQDYNEEQENGYKYQFFKFLPEIGGRLQYIAYIDCYQKYFVKLYIDCKTKEGIDQYITDFYESVIELHYMNITLKTE